MPPNARAVQRILARLGSTRPSEQRSALQALLGWGGSSAGRQALFAAGTLPALLQCAIQSEPAVAELALAMACELSQVRAGSRPDIARWRAAMLAGPAVPLLVQLLDSSHQGVLYNSIALVGALACGQDCAAAAAALVQHGAVPPLVRLARHTRSPNVQIVAARALCELAHVRQVASSLLQSGAAQALVPLLLDSHMSVGTQQNIACALGLLAGASEQCGQAVLRAGGIQALVRAVSLGSGGLAEDAADALLAAVDGAPSLQAAIIAEGGIPALEAFCRTGSEAAAAERAGFLLRLLRAARQAQQEAAQEAAQQGQQAGRDGSPSSTHSAATAAALPAPAPTGRASRQLPHVCKWCGDVAPAGTRFKKCAACQQVSGLRCVVVAWLALAELARNGVAA